MNNNCKNHNCNEFNNNAKIAGICIPETNVSTGSMHVHIGSLSVAGIELKEVACDVTTTITDKNIEVQCDFVGKLLGQLIAKFGDSIRDNIDAAAEYTKTRTKLIEAEIETEASKKAKYDAEAETEKVRKEKFEAEYKAWQDQQSKQD